MIGVMEAKCNIEIEYSLTVHASAALEALQVDDELQPDKVNKKYAIKGNKLLM